MSLSVVNVKVWWSVVTHVVALFLYPAIALIKCLKWHMIHEDESCI
jgi:hypothetical protein